ncbi:MAG: acetolactate synthase small subunit [Saprospiraceae bacterium]
MIDQFTVTVYSENKSGILSRVVGIITRRHINIESLTVSKSSMEGIHRFTIRLDIEENRIKKLVAQIEKQVEILKAFYYRNDEIVYQEVALYKVPIESLHDGDKVENLLRKHNARILAIEPKYAVIEKTGHDIETEALLVDLKETGIYEFVRSGRVAIVKPMEKLNSYLNSLENKYLQY